MIGQCLVTCEVAVYMMPVVADSRLCIFVQPGQWMSVFVMVCLCGTEEVVDFFASLRLECGDLSRDSHISALVLNVRTAIAHLQSLESTT